MLLPSLAPEFVFYHSLVWEPQTETASGQEVQRQTYDVHLRLITSKTRRKRRRLVRVTTGRRLSGCNRIRQAVSFGNVRPPAERRDRERLRRETARFRQALCADRRRHLSAPRRNRYLPFRKQNNMLCSDLKGDLHRQNNAYRCGKNTVTG